VATAQCRSRENSLDEAKKAIIQKLNGQMAQSHAAEQSVTRKQQIGSGMRGDKIRTYRFQDDTVKDHITGKSASVDKVLAGNFNLLW
jgi:protein subunit release factor A